MSDYSVATLFEKTRLPTAKIVADNFSGRPRKDAAFSHLDYGKSVTSCCGNIRAKEIEVCNLLGDRAIINNLTVNHFSVQELINLDCVLNDCFVVDNRGLQYCDTVYQTIQAAVDAACASDLPRAVICVAPSDYPENVIIPSNCSVELVIRGASNANETTTGNSQILGTVTVNAPVVFDNMRIDSRVSAPGMTTLDVDNVAGIVGVPFCLLHDCDVTGNATSPAATLEISSTSGTFCSVRADNCRISRLPSGAGAMGHRAVYLNAQNTGFIMTGDTNLRSNFVNQSTRGSGINGPLLVNSSIQGTVEQLSATDGIRLHDVRLTSGTLEAFVLSTAFVASTNPITVVNGFVNSTAAAPLGYVTASGGGTPITAGALTMTNVADLAGTGFAYLTAGGFATTPGSTIDGPVFSLANVPVAASNAAAIAAGVAIGGLYRSGADPDVVSIRNA